MPLFENKMAQFRTQKKAVSQPKAILVHFHCCLLWWLGWRAREFYERRRRRGNDPWVFLDYFFENGFLGGFLFVFWNFHVYVLAIQVIEVFDEPWTARFRVGLAQLVPAGF